MHDYNHILAVQMLDLLLEFFVDDAYWMVGHYHDGDRRRCLVGALDQEVAAIANNASTLTTQLV